MSTSQHSSRTIVVRALKQDRLRCPLNFFPSGFLSGGVGGAMYFGRAPYKQGVLSAKNDPSAGPNAPHYEIIYGVSPALTVA